MSIEWHTAKRPDVRWAALGMLCLAELILVLDDTVVNIALPSIEQDLHFSQVNLAWVVNAYMLAFGGLLLLGGRAADLFGRRRMFLIGIVLFGVSSATNGFAQSQDMLIISRAFQGAGAAIVSPAALSLVTTLFTETKEREKALGIWTTLAAVGATLGVVLSGAIVDLVSWRWIFYINIPVAIIAFVGVTRLVQETDKAQDVGFDVLAAVMVTGSLTALVNALLGASGHGWGSARTLGGFAIAIVLMAAFIVRQATAERPLVRLGFFRNRRIAVSNVLQLGANACIFGLFFMLTLYMQQVLHYSPLKAGLSWLAFCGGLGFGFGIGQALIGKLGVRPILVVGEIAVAIGMFTFTRLPVDGSYVSDIMPGMIVTAFGLAWCFLPITIAAVADADDSEAGLASGLLNTGQQIGSAVGLAVFVTLATERGANLIASGASPDFAQVSGTRLALGVAGGIAVAGALLAVTIGNLKPDAIPQPAAPGMQPRTTNLDGFVMRVPAKDARPTG